MNPNLFNNCNFRKKSPYSIKKTPWE